LNHNFGAHPSKDFIEINWQLSYSGRTPLKFFSADSFVPANRVLHNESDYKKVMEHDNAELMSEYSFCHEARNAGSQY
jgi:hypothetical protein